jgi:hypothetical protein
MSYTYLLEQGEESSAASFSDIPQCVLSRLNLIAGKSCCKGSGTESCQSFQSGMMSPPSTELRGGEKSMSSAEDSRAKTSQSQGGGLELKASEADSGQKWPESLAKYDPNSRSWRTAQCLLFEDLGESLETFPKWGIMRGGECWDMTNSVVNISAIESGLLPTPTKQIFSLWSSAKSKFLNDGKRKSGVKIGSILWWEMAEQHLRLGGEEDRKMIPDPSCGEVVMGWPMEWTELQPLATDKFHLWLRSHGEFLEVEND